MTLGDMLDMGVEIQGRVEIQQVLGFDDDYVTLLDGDFSEIWCMEDVHLKVRILDSKVAYMYPKMGDYGREPVLCIELAED